MSLDPAPLPQFLKAPIRHEFRRLDDLMCWTRRLLGKANFDSLPGNGPFHSSHRDLLLGGLHLSHSDYAGGGVRIDATLEDQVLFTFNAAGTVRFQVKGEQQTPHAFAGVLMVTPSEGQYIRGDGGGILLSVKPQLLLQTAQAIQGPMAERLVRRRLKQPLSFYSYASADRSSLPLSLLQSLRLVDSLMDAQGHVPAALRLDDLISRQLVLMLAPELLEPDDEQPGQHSAASFERLLEWILGRLDQPMGLSDLELRSGYSRRALQRAFQSRFDCGPMQWVRQRRLAQALEQLTQADANASVSLIARRCGYLSLSSFSRDFSRAYGRRPSDVLRANRSW